MRWVGQLTNRVKFDLLMFRRNPAAAFFTVVLPLIFLLLFTSIFGNDTLSTGAKVATFYVPGILGLSVVSSTMVNLAMTTTTRRERGILKRVRATPLPPWVFVASQIVVATLITALMTVLVVGIGRVIFGVSLQLSAFPTLIITLLISTGAFCALGLALSTIIPSENAAPAVTNAIALPLYFVSDVFIVSENTPRFIEILGGIFPVRHLVEALQPAFNPFVEGTPMAWGHWAVIAAWGAFGLIVAVTRFRWAPR
ncbi:MAG: ABC transporter permease [Acidimicrobiales bacterium]